MPYLTILLMEAILHQFIPLFPRFRTSQAVISSTNSTCIVPAQGLFAIALRWQLLFWRLAVSSEPWPWVSRHASTVIQRYIWDTQMTELAGFTTSASIFLPEGSHCGLQLFWNTNGPKCKSKLQHPGWCFCSSWLRNTYPSHANCIWTILNWYRIMLWTIRGSKTLLLNDESGLDHLIIAPALLVEITITIAPWKRRNYRACSCQQHGP